MADSEGTKYNECYICANRSQNDIRKPRPIQYQVAADGKPIKSYAKRRREIFNKAKLLNQQHPIQKVANAMKLTLAQRQQ